MKVAIEIRKYNIKENLYSYLTLIALPFFICYGLVLVLFTIIYVPIKKYLLKIEDKKQEENMSFFQNDKFMLLKNPIYYGDEENEMAFDFLYSIHKYDDDMEIFKVINSSLKTEIDNEYLTGFFVEFNNEILLQRIKYDKQQKPTSELIGFDPLTGKIKNYAEIGIFELQKFNQKGQVITGYNKTEKIKIKLSASA